MTFLDEEVRDAFHKISTLMQIVVSILEFECAKFHGQLELIGCEEDVSLLACPDMRTTDMFTVCDKINSQFKRYDKKFTCVVHDTTLKTFKVFVTAASDLEQLH